MKKLNLFVCYYVLTTTLFFMESSTAKRVVKVDDAFYTSTIVKNEPVDREAVTEYLSKMCDGTEFCQVFLRAFDTLSKKHPNMDLHVSYHCECDGRTVKTGEKTVRSNRGLLAIECAELPPTLWDSVTSFAGNLINRLSSSNSEPIATPTEAAPLMGDKHQKED